MNRTDRLMGILLELQARRLVRAEDLAGRFEVSVRTIYRDVQALSETGVPIVAMPGHGYQLMAGYFLPPLTFSEEEAAALVLGGDIIRQRVDSALQRAADSAVAKLFGVLPAERRELVEHWQQQLLFAETQRLDEAKLADLRRATQRHQVVRLRYQTPQRPEAEEREVEPTTLVHLAGIWHLAGYCRLRQAPRLFRFDRIDRYDILPETFELAARHQAGERRLESEIYPEARIRVEPAVARWMRERPPFFYVREERDETGDAPIFVYALRDEEAVVQWLLPWANVLDVLTPARLRDRLAAAGRAIASRHTAPAVDAPVEDHS